jgi:hypothetical protein
MYVCGGGGGGGGGGVWPSTKSGMVSLLSKISQKILKNRSEENKCIIASDYKRPFRKKSKQCLDQFLS